MRNMILAVLMGVLTACAGGGHHAHYSDAHERTEGSLASDIPLEWYSLREGREVAMREGKPLIVEYYAPESCSRCDKMAKYVWSDPQIVEAIERDFVLVRIDLTRTMSEEAIALGRKYDYQYDCLLIFLDYQGEVIEDMSGNRMCFADAVEPEWFLQYLDRARERGTRTP